MPDEKPRVVIVGAGFGGLNAAQKLKNAPVEVVLIDRNNFHLFQPLLYQVATSGLSPTDIAYPVRAIFRKQRNFTFRLAEATGVDLNRKVVLTSTGPVSYDYLVLAPGGETNFFRLESVEENGVGLKYLDDAINIRNHLLRMFELAAQEVEDTACRALRTFVVVGGGPTGVEFAGALSELIRLVLVKDFPDLDLSDVRVLLLEMTDRLLPGFPEELAEEAVKTLERKHVEVRLNAQVDDFNGTRVLLTDGEEIPACTLVWAAGVRAVRWLGDMDVELGKQGRVVVEETLQIPGHPEAFVVGDAAYMEDDGNPLPMVAPVAIQQAKRAAENIERLIQGKEPEEFDYVDPGSLATIGRNAAVAHVKGFKFRGFLAWLVWLAVHLFWLIGFRNRLSVLINWAYDYILYERAVRLITPKTGEEEEKTPA